MFSPFALGGFSLLFVVLTLWSIFWKAWALWIAARRGEKVWFGVMLVVNTVGILEILYIYVFSKDKTPEIMKSIMVDVPKVEETKPEVKAEEKPENK
mgnify:CR=1 FL=1